MGVLSVMKSESETQDHLSSNVLADAVCDCRLGIKLSKSNFVSLPENNNSRPHAHE